MARRLASCMRDLSDAEYGLAVRYYVATNASTCPDGKGRARAAKAQASRRAGRAVHRVTPGVDAADNGQEERLLPDLQAVPEEERQTAAATWYKDHYKEDLRRHGACLNCMVQVRCCICQALAQLSRDLLASGVESRCRFVVWMHTREHRRASNTGKLLRHLLPGVASAAE
eukprot:TRINITY_DN54121_c0_g1_i2.p2 TRINITY_DN54121_c0_g1~~TRINITY_DN54121_c0_g1_i2.p2  ORF type:complete len:171 (+),score=30.03 TRINITY_DN54121_c0_g1_i2:39-551(+)